MPLFLFSIIFLRGDLCDTITKNQIYIYILNLKSFFDSRSGPATDGLCLTVTIRQIMWALKIKPVKRERWETCFDRRII